VISGINQTADGQSKRRRPRFTPAQKWVLALSLLALALGLGNLVRMVMALRYGALLPELPLTVPLTYLAVMGGLWGLVFLACAAGLARFRQWGRWGTLVAVTLYQIHVWANHLLFDASDYARQTRPRDALLTALLLALTWGSLNLRRIRRVFKERER
jgi:hypothetical protein